MTRIVFATHNDHKLKEINDLITTSSYKFTSLKELEYIEEIEETGATLEENALIKARTINDHFKASTISEDTGLEVDALDNAPGVYTARFAGPEKDANKNMDLVLAKLKNNSNRKAQFRTIIALIHKGEEILFEGICKGTIAMNKMGAHGFGYDPIFIPNGFDQSFAQLGLDIKNKISHRAKAMNKLMKYLNKS